MRISDWSSDVCSSDLPPPARLGLAVSRKVDPHAVGRNRIKRVLRDAFRLLRPQLVDGDYVVVARKAAADSENKILREGFMSLLQRAGTLPQAGRSEERRGGKECGSTGRSRWVEAH